MLLTRTTTRTKLELPSMIGCYKWAHTGSSTQYTMYLFDKDTGITKSLKVYYFFNNFT